MAEPLSDMTTNSHYMNDTPDGEWEGEQMILFDDGIVETLTVKRCLKRCIVVLERQAMRMLIHKMRKNE